MTAERCAPFTFFLLLSACMDPLVSDAPGYSANLLPEDTVIDSVMENASVRTQIDRFDQLEQALIPRQRAYAAGAEVYYWDFGPAPRFAIPVWIFRRCDQDGMPMDMVGHPNLIDAVPGDRQYSPFWSMYMVCVTDAYGQERMTTVPALQDALELGLIETPRPTGMWANCPVTLDSARVEVGGSEVPQPPHDGFYRGMKAFYYHLGGMDAGVYQLGMNDRVVAYAYVYRLARASTPDDTETVFEVPRRVGDQTAPGYTPLFRVVRVVMDDGYTPGRLRSAADFVSRDGEQLTATDAQVRSLTMTDTYLNLAIQFEEGRL